MSTDFDQRGREAGARMRALVIHAQLHPSVPGLAGATSCPASRPMLQVVTAAASVLAVVVVLTWILVPDPRLDTPVATTTTPTLAPTTATAATTLPPGPAPEPTDEGSSPRPGPVTTVTESIPLSLVITAPSDGAVFSEKTIEFAGTTNPGAEVFAGDYQATVDGGGNWSIVLILSEGTNTASFRAVDGAGSEVFASITVTYAPPTTTTKATEEATTTQPDLAEFDANFTWGTCNVDPPFDEYYGVGHPGSEVTVQSEYGSGNTVVGEDGHWYLKVVFPEAPSGVAFLVKVKDQYGREEYFEFKSTVGI